MSTSCLQLLSIVSANLVMFVLTHSKETLLSWWKPASSTCVVKLASWLVSPVSSFASYHLSQSSSHNHLDLVRSWSDSVQNVQWKAQDLLDLWHPLELHAFVFMLSLCLTYFHSFSSPSPLFSALSCSHCSDTLIMLLKHVFAWGHLNICQLL